MNIRYVFWTLSLAVMWCCSPAAPTMFPVGNEKDLIPEGITIDPEQGTLYLSSFHKQKLIAFEPGSGQVRDFIQSGAYGYLQGTGIAFKDSLLFALGGTVAGDEHRTALFVFNAATGQLLHHFQPGVSGEGFFNDLAISARNELYITDTRNHKVYKLEYPHGQPELFLEDKTLQHPNGIAISEDNNLLYVDSWTHGIRVVNLKTGKILNPKHEASAGIGIDGLKYYRGALYAIRNGSKDKSKHGLIKLNLMQQETQPGALEPILIGHPAMNVPTTFCIAGGFAYILANSQLELLDQESNRIRHPDSLTRTYIIKHKL